jgi:hypothetical protein
MIAQPEPMTMLSEAEWRCIKRAIRRCRHRQRLERIKEPPPVAWLAAVERDDRRDERIKEQAA